MTAWTDPANPDGSYLADLALIRSAAYWSAASYAPERFRAGSVAAAGYRMKKVQVGVASALVVLVGPFVLIAARGTVSDFRRQAIVSSRDWLTNFRAGSYGGRHCGFERESAQLVARLPAALRALQAEALPVVFTGHSQGGALAANLALDMDLPSLHRVVMFGAPPTFGRRVAAMYDASYGEITWRVQNGPDPVSQLMPLRFDPVGRLAYLDAAGAAWPRVRRWDFARRIVERNHALHGKKGYLAKLGGG